MPVDQTALKVIRDLEVAAKALEVVNENGDLCRDGIRSTNFLQLLANHLLEEIELEGEIGDIADKLHETYVQLAGTKNI